MQRGCWAALGWLLLALNASAAPAAATRAVLARLKSSATAAQYQAVSAAIAQSPVLEAQIDALTKAGKLTAITVAPLPKGIFNVVIDGTRWNITPDFIARGNPRLHDVVGPDSILPNNMVFALGHLAYHAQQAGALKQQENTSLQDLRSTIQAGPHADVTNNIKAMMEIRLHDEAGAFIQGWNDVVDAAQHQYGSLSVPKIGSLLLNLYYRPAFLGAMNAKPAITIDAQGQIAMTQANLDIMADALKHSKMIDVQ